MNIKSIPSSARNENTNTLQIAIKTRIKLIYRPTSITGKPEDVTTQLSWHAQGNQLIVENPTPFYMNFQEIKLDGKKVDKATYAAPKSETHFTTPGNNTAHSVSWKIINDYGGISQSYTAHIK